MIKADTVLTEYQPKLLKKRMLAGAVCPKCETIDSIQVTLTPDNEITENECLQCHHVKKASPPPELLDVKEINL